MRCISHISIPAPRWCNLPSDTIPENHPFHGGQSLPQLLKLDDSSRCSCDNGGPYGDEDIKELPFIIFASTSAIKCTVQTVYCRACPYTKARIGPDLGNYSIFNYNNQWGFSHELLNSFTNRLVCQSETTFVGFHQTMVNAYIEEQSPVGFCEAKIFEQAWFAFVRIQELATPMQCSVCGPNPDVVIADGVAVSFPRSRIKDLRPPTIPTVDKAHILFPKTPIKCTSFPGPARLQSQVYKALCESEKLKRMEQLQAVICDFQSVPNPPYSCNDIKVGR